MNFVGVTYILVNKKFTKAKDKCCGKLGVTYQEYIEEIKDS